MAKHWKINSCNHRSTQRFSSLTSVSRSTSYANFRFVAFTTTEKTRSKGKCLWTLLQKLLFRSHYFDQSSNRSKNAFVCSGISADFCWSIFWKRIVSHGHCMQTLPGSRDLCNRFSSPGEYNLYAGQIHKILTLTEGTIFTFGKAQGNWQRPGNVLV